MGVWEVSERYIGGVWEVSGGFSEVKPITRFWILLDTKGYFPLRIQTYPKMVAYPKKVRVSKMRIQNVSKRIQTYPKIEYPKYPKQNVEAGVKGFLRFRAIPRGP